MQYLRLAWPHIEGCAFDAVFWPPVLLLASLCLQVFIDYNISGMSYVHLRNALFLQPLPEVSSIPSSQQPARDHFDPNDAIINNNKSALSGIFTSATVPEYLVANPNGQTDLGRPAATMSSKKQTADRATDSAERIATARELEPVTLQGDTEEVEMFYSMLVVVFVDFSTTSCLDVQFSLSACSTPAFHAALVVISLTDPPYVLRSLLLLYPYPRTPFPLFSERLRTTYWQGSACLSFFPNQMLHRRWRAPTLHLKSCPRPESRRACPAHHRRHREATTAPLSPVQC